jgi:hypothetical protein
MNPTAPQPGDGAPAHVRSTARRIHEDIQQALHLRRARGARLEAIEEAVKTRGLAAWSAMKRHPFLTIAVLGACGVAAAAAVGVVELAFGTALALAAYKVLREGEPPMEALADVEHMMRG